MNKLLENARSRFVSYGSFLMAHVGKLLMLRVESPVQRMGMPLPKPKHDHIILNNHITNHLFRTKHIKVKA